MFSEYRLGRKCLIATNTLSYYILKLITATEGFIVNAPVVYLIKTLGYKFMTLEA